MLSLSRRVILVCVSTLIASCSGGGAAPPVAQCVPSEKEAALDTVMASIDTPVDFSFIARRPDGREYRYERGTSTVTTDYESASTSKWVTATVILRLVDKGYLSLDDHPQKYITDWPIAADDPLYNITLAQLLSFTSGLTDEPLCLNVGAANFANCVNTIATTNAHNGIQPGSAFYYASTHLQVAGLMAVRARGFSSWTQVFQEFQTETGLFPTAHYDLPSADNPRLAGGMHWKATEYLDFLARVRDGTLLSPALTQQSLLDRTAGLTISYSPATAALGEEWHYGLGYWHECEANTFAGCSAAQRMSSPGAYGAYPFWDRRHDYIAILARQGPLGSFSDGAAIERTFRPQVEAWVACH